MDLCATEKMSDHLEWDLSFWTWENLVQLFEIVVGKLDIDRSAVLANVFRPAGFRNCNQTRLAKHPGQRDLSRCGAVFGGDQLNRDRKSTRLNSSHQIISYAVFCLKKKKKKYYLSFFKKKKINIKQN